jgi:hypothetical protein
LAIRENASPDAWARFYALLLLGDSLIGQDRYAEAEQPTLSGYEGMKAREAQIPFLDRSRRIDDAAVQVVHLYEEWGKRDQATAWKARLGMPDLPTRVFVAR